MYERNHYCWRSSIVLYFLLAAVVLLISTQAVPAETRQGKTTQGAATEEVAKPNIQGVVHVEAIKRQEVTNQEARFASSFFIKQFFSHAHRSGRVRQELKMLGTGMIIDARGHVLTNQHVVAGTTKIYVLLADGRRYAAKLVGADPATDMAVIRVLTQDSLPHVIFGTSDSVEVGESIAAVAHLRPQDPFVSHGTILVKHGSAATAPLNYDDYFEKEPAVNLGYSGGPLFNRRGEVIAVNVAILSGCEDFTGIAFSIPSRVMLHTAGQLIAGRKARGSSSEGRAECLIASLVRTTSMRGLSTASARSRSYRRQADQPDITSGLVRAGSARHDIPGAMTNDKTIQVNGKGSPGESDRSRMVGTPQIPVNVQGFSIQRCLGVAARPSTPEEARRYHLDRRQTVVVSSLEPKCPLAHAGVEVNDMILEVNGHRIGGFDQFVHLLSRTRPRQRVTILILDHRTGRAGYIQVRAQ